jgi:hypothetical protein
MLLLRSHHGCPLRRRHHGCALRLRHHRSTLLWRGPGLLRRHPKPGRALRGRGSRHVLGPLGHHREPGIALRGRQRNHGCALLRRRHRKKPESASVRLQRGHRGLMLGCGNIRRSGGEPLGVRVGHLSSGPASVASDDGSARRRRLGFSRTGNAGGRRRPAQGRILLLECRCQFWLAPAERSPWKERQRRCEREGSSGQPAGVMPRVSEGAGKLAGEWWRFCVLGFTRWVLSPRRAVGQSPVFERMRPIDGDWQTISCFLGQKQMLSVRFSPE